MVGVSPLPVTVEVDVSRGQPCFTIVGLGDLAVQEARERIWSAIRNSPFQFPLTRKTVNLAPSGARKVGTHYDLAIAVALLGASGQCPAVDARTVLLAELGLDGALRPVRGILPLVLGAQAAGATRVVVAPQDAREASLCRGVRVHHAGRLEQVVRWLEGRSTIPELPPWNLGHPPAATVDLGDVRGQPLAKRALEVAAVGEHGLLLSGPPGAGKTLLAQALVGLLPEMSWEEVVEATSLHSLAATLPPSSPVVQARPFRSPHHTSSGAALVGGGSAARPGEVSLAHRGVLFLDELPLFRRDALEALREPLEHGWVHVGRARGTVRYPADALVVAAMNPCPCGPRPTGCSCAEHELQRYHSRLSGPLLDRIDLHVQVERVGVTALLTQEVAEPSSTVLQRVVRARATAAARGQEELNARIPHGSIERRCLLDDQARAQLHRAADHLGLSARAVHRTLRVARSIADLDGATSVGTVAISEALQYRPSQPR